MSRFKVTGLRLSPECVMRLKLYCFATGRTMSDVVERLVKDNIGMYTGEPVGLPEENTSESE